MVNLKKCVFILLICFSCTSNKNETESKLVIIEGKIKNLKDSTIDFQYRVSMLPHSFLINKKAS